MTSPARQPTIVLGAGLAGLSTAYFLGGDCLVLEARAQAGGLASSRRTRGFVFDCGGHAVHSRRRAFFTVLRQLGCDLHWQPRRAFARVRGTTVPYPFQEHLFLLPPALRDPCYAGLRSPLAGGAPDNYRAWLRQRFGSGLCRLFLFPYNEKLWKSDLRNLAGSFNAKRIPAGGRKALLADNRARRRHRPYPVGYPLQGGIQALTDAFLPHVPGLRLRQELTELDPLTRMITVNGRQQFHYDRLIATIPLPELLARTAGLPPELRAVRQRLHWLSLTAVNIALRIPARTDWQRLYVADPDIAFHKVVWNSNSAPGCAPAGRSSISVEITRPGGTAADPARLRRATIAGLLRLGLLAAERDILFTELTDLPYAYILCDRYRDIAVARCRDWYARHGIVLAGRSGSWAYLNMDDVILQARDLARARHAPRP